MTRRVTITLDEDLVKKIRVLQAKEITKNSKAISFSSIINEILRKSIK